MHHIITYIITIPKTTFRYASNHAKCIWPHLYIYAVSGVQCIRGKYNTIRGTDEGIIASM